MITQKKQAANPTCNNTKSLTAVSAFEIALKDMHGNATPAPPGIQAKLRVRVERLSNLPPLSNAPVLDPRLALPESPAQAAAAAASQAASSSAATAATAAAAAAAAAAAGSAGIVPEVPVPPLSPPELSLPPAVTFDANGVAKLGATNVAQACGGDECKLVFTVDLLGWSRETMGEPPTCPPMVVRFENTHRMGEARARQREEMAEKDRLCRELQEAHDIDLAQKVALEANRRTLLQQQQQALGEAHNLLKRLHAVLPGMGGQPNAQLLSTLTSNPSALSLEPYESKLRGLNDERFTALLCLNQSEESALSSDGQAVGVFASIFEIDVSNVPSEPWTPEMVQNVCAVLSDQLGSACLKMAVTQTNAAYQRLNSRINLPRWFVLDSNNARSQLLRQVEIPTAGIWPAWQLLAPSPHLAEATREALWNKVLPKYVGSLLIARNESVALAYKQTMYQRNKDCPTIVALDGFNISGQGHLSGRSSKKITSLQALRRDRKPHFGFSNVGRINDAEQLLAGMQRQRSGLLSIAQKLGQLSQQVTALDQGLAARANAAWQQHGRQLNDALLPAPHAAAAAALPAPAAYATRHRSADEANLAQNGQPALRQRRQY